METPLHVQQGQTITGELRLAAHNRQSYDVFVTLSAPPLHPGQPPQQVHPPAALPLNGGPSASMVQAHEDTVITACEQTCTCHCRSLIQSGAMACVVQVYDCTVRTRHAPRCIIAKQVLTTCQHHNCCMHGNKQVSSHKYVCKSGTVYMHVTILRWQHGF